MSFSQITDSAGQPSGQTQCPCFSAPSVSSFFYLCPSIPAVHSQMFSFLVLVHPHPSPPGHVTLLPSRKSLSTICLAGCDEFGGLAKQINSVKLMTLSVGINFARVCLPEMLHNPQRHLIYPVAEGRCVGRGRRVGGDSLQTTPAAHINFP